MNRNNPLAVEPETEIDAAPENFSVNPFIISLSIVAAVQATTIGIS